MGIVFRDLLKPRYAVVVTIDQVATGVMEPKLTPVPVVKHLVFKRPLGMPLTVFYNTLKERFGVQSLVFCGYYWSLRSLYGIGACSRVNLQGAVRLGSK